MHHWNVSYIILVGKLPKFQFKKSNQGRINADSQNKRREFAHRISLMKTKNIGEPIFRIIRDHSNNSFVKKSIQNLVFVLMVMLRWISDSGYPFLSIAASKKPAAVNTSMNPTVSALDDFIPVFAID